MKRNEQTSTGITGVTIHLSIFELARLANLKYELEHQSATPETISGLTSVINFFDKIVGDVPSSWDVDKELFGDVEAQLAGDDARWEVVNTFDKRMFIGTHAECGIYCEQTFDANKYSIREIDPLPQPIKHK